MIQKIFFNIIIFLILSLPIAADIIAISPETTNNITNTKSGDTIILNPGQYKLNIELKDGISITSNYPDSVIIEPAVPDKPVILKYGAGIIENLRILNGGSSWYCNGIYVTNSNAVIKNNYISNNNQCGIYASFFTGIIENNIIENNKFDGIKIYNSTAQIKNNLITNNKDDGVQLLHSRITIDSNIINNNGDNGIELWFDNKSVITNNNLNNNKKPVFVLAGDTNFIFEKNLINNKITDFERFEEIKPTQKNSSSVQTASQKSFVDDTETIDKTLYYLMLNPTDFNIDYRIKIDTMLEIPLFTKLFSRTLDTGKTLKEIADSLIGNETMSSKIEKIFEIENNVQKKNINNFGSKLKIKFPKYFPEELGIYVNEIYHLTELYAEQLKKLESKFTTEEFDFIKEKISNSFSNTGMSCSFNIRESLKNSDDEDKNNLRLRMLLSSIDIFQLQITGYNIIKYCEKIKKINFSKIKKSKLEKEILFSKNTEFGEIRIAGEKDNLHQNSNCFILIDLGGDDYYKNQIASANLNRPVSLYFDFDGNDNYISDTNFDISSSFFGISYIYDAAGQDRYVGKNNSVAAAYFGISIIDDKNGCDFYQCGIYGLGAALFGIGLIQDLSGNDIYEAGAYCEGFGSVYGYGMIIDFAGSDYYLSGNLIIDSIRYYANCITMSQGCGCGIRPYIPGGLGLIIDKEGNDLYRADIFGQGTAYWDAMGALIDYSGDDKYISHRYSQGMGVHLAIATLMDFAGDDDYIAYNVSQGCGHDISLGLLYDKQGNDFYKMISLGQGAGITNAVGMLVDEEGNDCYFGLEREQGAAEYLPQREFGSIGIFYDKSGKDTYLKYKDNDIEYRGKYGLFYDK